MADDAYLVGVTEPIKSGAGCSGMPSNALTRLKIPPAFPPGVPTIG